MVFNPFLSPILVLPAPLHSLMKPLFWIIAIASLTLAMGGCASLNEWAAKREQRTYNSYANQSLNCSHPERSKTHHSLIRIASTHHKKTI